MSELERLIQEHCQNGVEYRKIGDVMDYEQPSKYIVNSTDYNGAFEIPVLTAGQTFILGYTNETDGIYNASKEKPVIIFDDFTGAFKWVDFPFKVKSSAMKILTAKEDIVSLRYIFHIMGKINFSSDEHKRLWISIYSELSIPVPPIEVQGEIVRILDNFTELTAELTAKLALELDARRKQYAYCCRTALTFGDSTPIVKLEEVASYSKDRIAIDCLTEDNYVGVENLLQNKAGKRNAEKVPTGTGNASGYRSDDILIGNIRPYLKKIWLSDCDGGTNGDVLVIRSHNKSILTPQYLYCVLSSDDFFDYDTKNSKGAKMPRGDKAAVMQYEFSLPTVAEQQKAVEIINRLNIAYADICSELSAEIEARQKQYGCYRDKLLSF